ncbi:substrate-binding domain-containing protein [Kitasatospora sp. NPDC096147]|uniref:substrate-binding domain-containing protein n=1 Tax=Kitasatospora sp. NPDC096147 TaxID=3364093 RepID=UPI0037FD9EE0
MRHTAVKLAATFAAAAALTLAAAPAQADPAVLPNAVDIVGTGSDTTAPYLAQVSADYNASIAGAPASTPRLYSWDPLGSATITPKSGAATINRPNGSSAGVTALNNNTATTVDFARSSRGPQTGDTTDDLFVAFAKDAVTWSAKATGGHAPANLTTAQLKGIYECTITNWSTVGGTAGTIKPFLPQNGSGTRTFFLKAIGGATPVTPGACVTSGPQENTGTTAALNDVDAIFPYSVASYISQVFGGHSTPAENPGPLTLRNVNGVAPVNASNTINAPFAASAYGRVVYNVVRASAWNTAGAYSTTLKGIFGPTGWICTHPSTITSYGFLALPGSACGSTTTI